MHLAHEVDPDADEQEHRPPTDQQGHEEGGFLARANVELDVVGDQVADQAAIQEGGVGAHTPAVGGDCRDFGRTRTFLNDHTADALGTDFVEELRVADVTGALRGTPVKLLEDGEQHHGDHHPYRNLGKPLIVQNWLLIEYMRLDMGCILGVSRRPA